MKDFLIAILICFVASCVFLAIGGWLLITDSSWGTMLVISIIGAAIITAFNRQREMIKALEKRVEMLEPDMREDNPERQGK